MQEQAIRAEPSGTVTYLYTDIEGSTRLWEQMPAAMQIAQTQHHAILRTGIEAHHGHVFQIRGDAFCATFWTALDGLLAALDTQLALAAANWNETGPLKVRMVVHTGVTDQHAGLHDGPFLNRVGRMLATAHGGQVLVGASTQTLVAELLPPGISLRDLGEHRLRDVIRPEHIYQLIAPGLPADFPPLETGGQVPNNLPVQLTRFIGRERELAQLTSLLATTRMLTMIGPGGTGKTRLALQLAEQQADRFPAGVWFIELAPVADALLVIQTIASTLGVREHPGQSLLATLTEYLRGKRVLLVLDNCEHLIGTCAHVVDELLRACSSLAILDTSREALDIGGEVLFPVPALSVPDPKQSGVSLSSLATSDAVQLFTDRAKSVRPDFILTPQNATTVAQICRQLDGVPLAIELAAARMKLLNVEQIATRLDDAFRLLTGGSRTALPRQQTLRASIDWSYMLLAEHEKILFARLAVFAGGWQLEAAEAVCAGREIEQPDVLDLLQALVDKSLVVVDKQHEQVRYRFLQIIHQYAQEKLQNSGAEHEAAVRMRHLQWCLSLAEAAEPHLQEPDQAAWLERLDDDVDNLRAALEWATTHTPEIGLQLAAALRYYWLVRGYLSEGRNWLERLLDETPISHTLDRAQALDIAGFFAGTQGHIEHSQQLSDASLALYRELNDTQGIASALVNLALIAHEQNNYPRSYALLEESLALRRERGNKGEIGHALANIAWIAYLEGDMARSFQLASESLALYQEAGHQWGIAHAYEVMGLSSLGLGDLAHADRYLRNGLQVARAIDDRYTTAILLAGLGMVEVKVGHLERGAVLFGSANNRFSQMNVSDNFSYNKMFDREIDSLRAMLGEQGFAAAMATGRAMTLEQALAYALEESPSSEAARQ